MSAENIPPAGELKQTWYRIRWDAIEPIEVVRETERFVYVMSRGYRPDERRISKEGLYRTREEAEGQIVRIARRNVAGLRERLVEAERVVTALRSKYPGNPAWKERVDR